MRIEWPGNRCIICLKETHLSNEHIIPKSIGGLFTCSFLCRDCNSHLGWAVESKIKDDPSIRFAMDALQSDIPDFTRRFTEGQEFLCQGPGGIERGINRGGKLRVKPRKTETGSLILSPEDGRKLVERSLRKAQRDECLIQEVLRKIDDAEENQKITPTSGVQVVKWPIEKVEPYLRNGKLLTSLVPLKIGYEFLALRLGTAIYNQNSALNELRDVLRKGTESHPSFQLESLHASQYAPFHGVAFLGNNPHAIVLIRLFGWIAFRVHFHRLTINHPSINYLHRLDTNQEDIQATNQSADTPRQSDQPDC